MRPINSKTKETALQMVRICLGDLNSGVEAAAYTLTLLSKIICQDEKVDQLEFVLGLLARCDKTLDQADLRLVSASKLDQSTDS